MKKTLNFNLQYNYLERQNFIQCFASVFTYLEMENSPEGFFYDPDVGGHCYSCGSGGELHHCKKDRTAAKRCGFFFLFNTMCGNSSIRRRFDGKPTEMQELLGDTLEGGRLCGSDYTVDFLFGYTGYEYRKCTDPALFKDEITASINAGKPVIAKIKADDPYFDIITGYDKDALMYPNVISYDFSVAPPALKPSKAPGYDELEALYIFGNKTNRRYTVKDGLNNIRRVMEYNIDAGLWDEYLKKLGGSDELPSADGLCDAEPGERKARSKNLAETNMYMYNFCSFGGAFDCEGKLPGHYLHKELFTPALSEVWNGINDTHWAIVDAGHITGKLNAEQVWLMDDSVQITALSTEICREIAKAKDADLSALDLINRAVAVLN